MVKFQNRDLSVDTLRGVACILLVQFHVVGIPNSGLEISEGFWRDFSDLFSYLRMPLFTFLSGLVYARRPFTSGAVGYLVGKVRRILLPMVTVGTVFAVAGILFIDKSYSWVQLLHLKPIEYLWYLQSLFTIFVLVALLEKKKLLSNGISFSIFFVLSMLVYLVSRAYAIEWFSLSLTFYLLPAFLTGLAYTRFLGKYLGELSKGIISLAIFVVAGVLGSIFLLTETGEFPLWLLFSCILCSAIMALNVSNVFLSKLGFYSYSIYLFHPFFVAFTRIVLYKIGVNSQLIHVCAGTLSGISGSLLAHVLLSQYAGTATAFLGVRFTRSDNGNLRRFSENLLGFFRKSVNHS